MQKGRRIFGFVFAIKNPPAVIIDGNLIIADIHLGYTITSYKYSLKAKLKLLRSELNKILVPILKLDYPIERVIILGDIKESLGYPSRIVGRSIGTLLRKIKERYDKLIVIRGNHDGRLSDIINEVNVDIKIVDSMIFTYEGEDILLTHGHMKVPMPMLLTASTIIMGHIHPASPVTGERIWVVAKFVLDLRHISQPYEKAINAKEIKLIILPHANSFLSGKPVKSRADIYELLKKTIYWKGSNIDLTFCSALDHRGVLVEIL